MDWQSLILEPLRTFLSQLAEFIPTVAVRTLFSAVAVVVGWFIASRLRGIVPKVLGAIGLDRVAEKARLSEVLRQGAIRLSLSELLGQLCYWLVMIATVIFVLQYLGVTAAEEWLERFGYFIPRVIISIVILLFGMLLASFFGATVRAASLNAGFPHGQMLGQVVYGVVVILASIVALEQLQVVTQTFQVALYIAMGAAGFAVALAIGLGSQEFVRKFLADLWAKWKSGQTP